MSQAMPTLSSALHHRPAAIRAGARPDRSSGCRHRIASPTSIQQQSRRRIAARAAGCRVRSASRAPEPRRWTPGLPRFLVIRPIDWSAIRLHAGMEGFDCRVAQVVVISVLDAIRLNRVLPRERTPTDLDRVTGIEACMRVLRGESLPEPLISILTARRGHRPIVERRISQECQQLTGPPRWRQQQQLWGQRRGLNMKSLGSRTSLCRGLLSSSGKPRRPRR